MATVKEVKLMKDGAMVTPVVLADSVKNLDGTNYKDSVNTSINNLNTKITNLENGKANNHHNHFLQRYVYDNSSTTDVALTLPAMEVGQWVYYSVKVTNDNHNSTYKYINVSLSVGTGTYIVIEANNNGISAGEFSNGANIKNHSLATQTSISNTGICIRVA
jgi:hypothetical protein